MHVPVLLHECVEFLAPKPGDFMIDGTVGRGGHSAEILKRITPNGALLCIDLDEGMIRRARSKIKDQRSKVTFVRGNYAELPEILAKRHLPKADGLLLDLGFSSDQLEHSGRGFSFLRNEPLLMTYDARRIPVKDFLRKISERELAEILRKYGEKRYAGRIAHAIAIQKNQRTISTSAELAEVVKRAVPLPYRHGRIHPATRTFQALRIYANDELHNLENVLSRVPDIVRPGGRVVIISFHSLEDRIVKHSLRELEKKGIARVLTKTPVTPSAQEIKTNPRSRSARLRAAKLKERG